jgi:hypothetical protein
MEMKETIEDLKKSKIDREKVLVSLKEKYPIEQFITFNEFDLKEKEEILPFKLNEFQEYLYKEEALYEDLIEKRDILIAEKYDYYKFHGDKRLSPSEIKEYYLKKEPDIIAFNKNIKTQKWIVDYFTGCVKTLDKMFWLIKDYIKTVRGI